MRLCAFVIVELAIVVLLAVALFGSGVSAPKDAAPGADPGRAVPVPAPADVPASAEPAPVVPSAPSPAEPSPTRTAVAARWNPDDPVGVLLTGSVRWNDGRAAAEASVGLRRGKDFRSGSSSKDGSYAVVGLAPGEWSLTVRADGAVDREETVTFDDLAEQRRDLVLDPSFAVKVRIVTADGQDGTRALRVAAPFLGDLYVVGRRERFPERLAPTDYGAVFLGDAKWDRVMNPVDGAAGTLFFAEPPPAHAALLLRHVVVDQQLVQPRQAEVEFVVDPEAVKKLCGRATVRVLDEATGAPLADASVMLGKGGGLGTPVGADGHATIEGLSPGYLRSSITAKDHENFYTTLFVDAGQTLDLGEVRLGASLPLRGVVLDADGKPAAASLSWTELKWHRTSRSFASNRSARTEADGTFSLWGTGRGLIAVRARGQDGKIAMGVFENPPPQPIELRLVPGAECTVSRPPDPTKAYTVTFYDARRRGLTAVTLEPRSPKTTVSLPPGDYTFEVHDERERLVQSGSLQFGPTPCALEIR